MQIRGRPAERTAAGSKEPPPAPVRVRRARGYRGPAAHRSGPRPHYGSAGCAGRSGRAAEYGLRDHCIVRRDWRRRRRRRRRGRARLGPHGRSPACRRCRCRRRPYLPPGGSRLAPAQQDGIWPRTGGEACNAFIVENPGAVDTVRRAPGAGAPAGPRPGEGGVQAKRPHYKYPRRRPA